MKSKHEHIRFWVEQAEDDWSAVSTLFEGKKYLQSLFFAHLVIEKLCKAIWIQSNSDNIPPRTHNLLYILSATSVDLDENQSEFLLKLNRFQLEGRYPEYLSKLTEICNYLFTKNMLETTNEIRLWLLKKVQ